MAENEVEAHKSIIEFNKTIITICSGILTAIIGLIVFQDITVTTSDYFILAPFVISIFLSLYGFGHTIAALRDQTNSNNALRMTNLSALVMIISIFLLFALGKPKQDNIDSMLESIEESTKTTGRNLIPENMQSILSTRDSYVISFKTDSVITKVNYSKSEKKITSIE